MDEPRDDTDRIEPTGASGSAPQQAPRRVILVRPHRFSPNRQTTADNGFQRRAEGTPEAVQAAAHAESTALAEALCSVGVGVEVFEDLGHDTPDSVFPNNWFSTHQDGTLVLYPMCAPNRRAERRPDVVAHLRQSGRVEKVLDYSDSETHGEFLEGTGAMVLDHTAGIAYACRSRRLSPRLFHRFCEDLGYTPVLFDAVDGSSRPVYHTNVLMSVGTGFAVIGSSMIADPAQRSRVLGTLRETGRTVVDLTEEQIRRFAGNCLEVTGDDGKHLVLSATAEASLTTEQRALLQHHCSLLSVDVSTIEAAGGSVRCMIAANHLQAQQPPQHWPPGAQSTLSVQAPSASTAMSEGPPWIGTEPS